MILSMNSKKMYRRNRFPPEIIQYAVWLFHRVNLGHRDTFFIDEVFAEIQGKQYYLWAAIDQDG
jgi:transposase-like protein